MSELRLYCDLLVQQVQTIQSQHSDDPETAPTSEVTTEFFVFCQRFVSHLSLYEILTLVKNKNLNKLSKNNCLGYFSWQNIRQTMKVADCDTSPVGGAEPYWSLSWSCSCSIFFPFSKFRSRPSAGVSSQCHLCNIHQDSGGVYEHGQPESDPWPQTSWEGNEWTSLDLVFSCCFPPISQAFRKSNKHLWPLSVCLCDKRWRGPSVTQERTALTGEQKASTVHTPLLCISYSSLQQGSLPTLKKSGW